MDEENLNVVDDTQENVVDSQETEQVETTEQAVNADSGEITTPKVEEKPVQSAEQNALYASIRREAETKAQDKLIAEMYGASHGIYTKVDYDKAMQAQQEEAMNQSYRDAGIDPDVLKQLINDNPAIKQANEIVAKQQQDSKINAEVQDLFAEFPEARDSKIPDSVFLESIEKGVPLSYAYAKYATKNAQTIAEQKALKGITQNAQTTPGALSAGQQEVKTNFSNMPSQDFNSLVDRVLRGEKIDL